MNKQERIEELLAERVTEGLSPGHEAELERLLGGPVDASAEAARWEAAAAALAVASVGAEAARPLPPELARALCDDAELFVASARRDERKRVRAMTTGAASAAEMGPDEGRAAALSPASSGARWGWLAAAAAFALFAGQTWRLEASGRSAAAAPSSSTFHATCSAEGRGAEPAGELIWNARDGQGVLVFDRTPAPAPSASGHVVYRCAPVAP